MTEEVVEVEKAAKNYWSSGYASGGMIREVELCNLPF